MEKLSESDSESVRITLRLPRDLHEGIVECMGETEQTISEWSRDNLEAGVHRQRTHRLRVHQAGPVGQGTQEKKLGLTMTYECPHPVKAQEEMPDTSIWCRRCGIQLLEATV